MSREDQERLEDYLELERYIEELQAGHSAHLPSKLTPDDAHIYRMLMLFRSASAAGVEPHPEFIVVLQVRLEHELQKRLKMGLFTFLYKRSLSII